jgi:release factor glutamine methyltransferase
LAKYSQKLRKVSERPELEAELILAKVLKKDRVWILAHSEQKIPDSKFQILNSLINRRLKGEPPAYLLGEQEFYGLPFRVNKNVLIPRPETEKLVDEIATSVASLPPRNDIIIDIGTGSGAIIVSLVKNIKNKNVKFFATDLSTKALAVAKQNAKLNGVDKNIKFLKGNLLEPIIKNSEIKNCLKIKNLKLKIAGNLPYLTPKQIANEKSIQYEPKLALNGGPDGLKYYCQLAAQVKKLRAAYPRLNLTLYLEADPDQMAKLKKMFAPLKARVIKDFCGRNRFLILN